MTTPSQAAHSGRCRDLTVASIEIWKKIKSRPQTERAAKVEVVGITDWLGVRIPPGAPNQKQMTVKELKQLLEKYPEEYLVMVPGYEHGYDSPKIERCGEIEVVKKQNPHDWEVEYEFSVGEPGSVKAVYLPRNSN